jgi:hypothetical protein
MGSDERDGGAEAKRYWWWRCPDDLFASHELMVLLSAKDGWAAAGQYCALCGKAVRRGGYLRFSKDKPYTRATLGALIGLAKAPSIRMCRALEGVGLLEWLKDGTALIPGLRERIGSETDSAARKRNYRLGKSDGSEGDGTLSRDPSQKTGQKSGHCPEMCPAPLRPLRESESSECDVTPSTSEAVDAVPSHDEEDDTDQEGVGGAEPPSPDSPSEVPLAEEGGAAECMGDLKGPELAKAMAEDFWAAYPKKRNHGAVAEWFAERQPTLVGFKGMMRSLLEAKGSADWAKQGGRFIPLPTNWLNGERWKDRAAEPTEGFEPSMAEFDADVAATVALAKKIFGGGS